MNAQVAADEERRKLEKPICDVERALRIAAESYAFGTDLRTDKVTRVLRRAPRRGRPRVA